MGGFKAVIRQMTNDNPSNHNASGGGRNEPPTEQHPVATALKSIEGKLQAAREDPTEYERESHRWAIRTGRGVIFYTILTAFIMAASVGTAIYSRWQATIADDSEKRSLRAYIGIENEKFVLNCDACDDPTKQTDFAKGFTDNNALFMEIKNYGHTPAFDATGSFNWKDAPYGNELPPDFTYADGANARTPGTVFVINPQERSHGGDLLDAGVVDFIKRARNHQITLYLYGHIDYTDVFKCRNVLKFCFRYAPDAKPAHSFDFCQAHNETPKDCQPQD
jgi:hypothetical protein